jgi:enediyne biosynthesis protein E5
VSDHPPLYPLFVDRETSLGLLSVWANSEVPQGKFFLRLKPKEGVSDNLNAMVFLSFDGSESVPYAASFETHKDREPRVFRQSAIWPSRHLESGILFEGFKLAENHGAENFCRCRSCRGRPLKRRSLDDRFALCFGPSVRHKAGFLPPESQKMKFKLPGDGRYYILANHLLLIFLGFTVFHFQRSFWQLLAGLGGVLITETVASRLLKKNQRGLGDRLLSATVAGLSLFILISSPSIWFYAWGGVIAILSKYLIKADEQRHLYNPTGFAIVILLALLPPYYFRVYGDEFNLHFFLIAQVLFFGILATVVSKRWLMSASYMAAMFFLALMFSQITPRGFLFYAGPELSANGLLFIWLMMPDPRTTPETKKSQIIIGCAVAALNLFLRHQEVLYSQFISLFTVASLRTAISAFQLDHFSRKLKNSRG